MNTSFKNQLSRCRSENTTNKICFPSDTPVSGTGRMSLRLSGQKKASVSVEASLVIPVFLLCFLELISVLSFLQVYGQMLCQIKKLGEPLSVYGYAVGALEADFGQALSSETVSGEAASGSTDSAETESLVEGMAQALLFSEGYLRLSLQAQWQEDGGWQVIDGGAAGVSFLGSYLSTDSEEVLIRAAYRVKPVISLYGLSCDLTNYYYSRIWAGYQTGETQEQMVYITENSEVYHLTADCSYLRLSIRSISAGQLDSARNSAGARYQSCSRCIRSGQTADTYYITASGDCYHISPDCSGLKRTVYQVPLSQVEGKRPCSRCGGGSADA